MSPLVSQRLLAGHSAGIPAWIDGPRGISAGQLLRLQEREVEFSCPELLSYEAMIVLRVPTQGSREPFALVVRLCRRVATDADDGSARYTGQYLALQPEARAALQRALETAPIPAAPPPPGQRRVFSDEISLDVSQDPGRRRARRPVAPTIIQRPPRAPTPPGPPAHTPITLLPDSLGPAAPPRLSEAPAVAAPPPPTPPEPPPSWLAERVPQLRAQPATPRPSPPPEPPPAPPPGPPPRATAAPHLALVKTDPPAPPPDKPAPAPPAPRRIAVDTIWLDGEVQGGDPATLTVTYPDEGYLIASVELDEERLLCRLGRIPGALCGQTLQLCLVLPGGARVTLPAEIGAWRPDRATLTGDLQSAGDMARVRAALSGIKVLEELPSAAPLSAVPTPTVRSVAPLRLYLDTRPVPVLSDLYTLYGLNVHLHLGKPDQVWYGSAAELELLLPGGDTVVLRGEVTETFGDEMIFLGRARPGHDLQALVSAQERSRPSEVR